LVLNLFLISLIILLILILLLDIIFSLIEILNLLIILDFLLLLNSSNILWFDYNIWKSKILLRRWDVLIMDFIKLFIIRKKYWVVEPEIILKFHCLNYF
jgi:hypothetical protein